MKLTNISIILFIILLISSCAPQSKEAYLERFKEFTKKTEEKCAEYTEQDWTNAEEEYNKYTGEWYKKFEKEFTWKEELKIKKYELKYNMYKLKQKSSNFFDSFYNNEYKDMKDQIKYYSENKMEDDLNYIFQQAKDAGDSATAVVEDIFDELNIEIEK